MNRLKSKQEYSRIKKLLFGKTEEEQAAIANREMNAPPRLALGGVFNYTGKPLNPDAESTLSVITGIDTLTIPSSSPGSKNPHARITSRFAKYLYKHLANREKLC